MQRTHGGSNEESAAEVPLEVVYVCAINRRGGPVQSVRTFAEGLTAIGHDVHVCAPGIDDEASVFTSASGTRHEIPPVTSLVAGLRAQWQVLRLVRRLHRGRRVLHANGMPELLVCLPAIVLLRTPCILWFHSTSLDRSRRAGPLLRFLMRFNTIRFAAVSPTAAALLGELGCRTPIEILPNPFDNSVICAAREDAPEYRIGFLSGGLDERKGGDVLAETIRQVLDGPWRWTIYTPNVEQAAATLDDIADDPNIDIRPKTTEVSRLFCDVDVVFVPSRFETFGRVVVEAWLNGIPVVGGDISAFRDLAPDGQFAGQLVEHQDIDGFVTALARFEDPEQRRVVGEAGRRIALDEYHIDRLLPRVESLYRDLAES